MRTKPESSLLRSRAHVVFVAVAALIAIGAANGCGGGKTPKVESTTTVATTTSTSGQVANGAQLFSNNCASCHGFNGVGGHIGPNLHTSPVAGHLAEVEAQIRHGGPVMPPFAGVLSNAEIDAIAHFVVERIAAKA